MGLILLDKKLILLNLKSLKRKNLKQEQESQKTKRANDAELAKRLLNGEGPIAEAEEVFKENLLEHHELLFQKKSLVKRKYKNKCGKP
jgi:hypothetical protein